MREGPELLQILELLIDQNGYAQANNVDENLVRWWKIAQWFLIVWKRERH